MIPKQKKCQRTGNTVATRCLLQNLISLLNLIPTAHSKPIQRQPTADDKDSQGGISRAHAFLLSFTATRCLRLSRHNAGGTVERVLLNNDSTMWNKWMNVLNCEISVGSTRLQDECREVKNIIRITEAILITDRIDLIGKLFDAQRQSFSASVHY